MSCAVNACALNTLTTVQRANIAVTLVLQGTTYTTLQRIHCLCMVMHRTKSALASVIGSKINILMRRYWTCCTAEHLRSLRLLCSSAGLAHAACAMHAAECKCMQLNAIMKRLRAVYAASQLSVTACNRNIIDWSCLLSCKFMLSSSCKLPHVHISSDEHNDQLHVGILAFSGLPVLLLDARPTKVEASAALPHSLKVSEGLTRNAQLAACAVPQITAMASDLISTAMHALLSLRCFLFLLHNLYLMLESTEQTSRHVHFCTPLAFSLCQ